MFICLFQKIRDEPYANIQCLRRALFHRKPNPRDTILIDRQATRVDLEGTTNSRNFLMSAAIAGQCIDDSRWCYLKFIGKCIIFKLTFFMADLLELRVPVP
jgi:hypothetical protein